MKYLAIESCLPRIQAVIGIVPTLNFDTDEQFWAEQIIEV